MLKEVETVALQSPQLEHITPEEEMVVIRDTTISAESQSKEGDTFYLISQRWWQQWLDYVNQDMTSTNTNGYGSHSYESSFPSAPKRPSTIDNTDLIDDVKSEVSNMEIELHDTLVEGRDYILLPQEVWNKLYGWYGGGPILSRKAINSGFSQTDLSIEVYPLRLHLLLMPKGERAVVRISKKETVGELHKKSCEVFDLILDQAYIWDFYGNKKHALMNDMDKTLDDANIQMDQDILVEVHNEEIGTLNGSYTATMQENGSKEKDSTSLNFDPSKSSVCSAEGSLTNKNISKSGTSEFPQSQHLVSSNNDVDNLQSMNIIGTRGGTSIGLIGLQNLGNTCFMNSAIQCLVHTPEFARYFQEDYRKEINWKNPLGMVGELALAFGELLRKLWAPGRTPVSPKPFKTKLARFAPQFSGYNQHDSQELLAFLLDGLHEDLNRVKHKPYIKTKDADGRPDEEVADEYWANHIARNDSIIVDVCQGQYKSTLVCPVCGKISVTFDPFMYLSLPLQSASARTMTIVVFSSDGSALPTPFTVTVPKQGRCKDLIQSLSSACSLKNGERLLLAEIHGHTIHRFLEDPLLLLSTIKDDDRLAAYKVPKPGKSTTLLQFVHRREEIDSADGSKVWQPYGIPLISQISCDGLVKSNDIIKLAHKLLLPMLHHEDNDEEESQDSKVAATSPGLHLVQDNECVDLTTEEKPLKLSPSSLSTSVMVYINWSQRDLMNYVTHYVENIPEVFKYAPAPKRIRGEPLSLYACLDAFLREEPLVPEDMWFCPRCKEQRQASKKLDLWRLPEVLVIHLKRFSFSRSSKNKLETYVNFPIHDLDLTNYVAHKKVSERQLYELYALSNHYGTMASGHYTAHIKLLDENKWYNFDDSHISPISEEDVRTPAAYVLFYRRVKSEEVSPGNKDYHYAIQPSNSSRR